MWVRPHSFHLATGVRCDDGGKIRVGPEAPNGIVIFGPYRRIPARRYRVTHLVDVAHVAGPEGHIEIDVVIDDGARRIAATDYNIKNTGPLELSLDFSGEGTTTEFRVSKRDVEFVHSGAFLRRI